MDQVLIVQVLLIWVSPESVGLNVIISICFFAAFEFLIAVHELVASASNRKIAFFMFLPCYLGVYIGTVYPIQSNLILFGFFAVVINRIVNALLNSDSGDNVEIPRMGGLALLYGVVCLLFVSIVIELIPHLGLTSAYLANSGYMEKVSNMGSDLIQDPKLSFSFLLLYWLGLLIYDLCAFQKTLKGLIEKKRARLASFK